MDNRRRQLGATRMKLSQADRIWNRAAMEAGGLAPREGDRALSDLLLAHGMIMNGGMEHVRVALSPAEYAAGIAGYRYFGLEGVAATLEQAREAADEEALESLSGRYAKLVPDDGTLVGIFQARLAESPESFSRLKEGEGEPGISADYELEAGARRRRRSGLFAVLAVLALVGLLVARALGEEIDTVTLVLVALILAYQLFVYRQLEQGRLRRRLESRWPAYCFNVSFDDQGITLSDARADTESLAWGDLIRVTIVTTGKGPDENDVCYLLETESGSLRIPQGAAGEDQLLARLQKLPGWDDEAVIEAMSSTEDATFPCWSKPSRLR